MLNFPAAFRRLCVETKNAPRPNLKPSQPPLGGCVLKQNGLESVQPTYGQPPLGGCVLKQTMPTPKPCRCIQPPLGGCVLKLIFTTKKAENICQPPLGGCVLKPVISRAANVGAYPAAFRRLCVETALCAGGRSTCNAQPPLGGCVLKLWRFHNERRARNQPPLGGCVLKHSRLGRRPRRGPSRL